MGERRYCGATTRTPWLMISPLPQSSTARLDCAHARGSYQICARRPSIAPIPLGPRISIRRPAIPGRVPATLSPTPGGGTRMPCPHYRSALRPFLGNRIASLGLTKRRPSTRLCCQSRRENQSSFRYCCLWNRIPSRYARWKNRLLRLRMHAMSHRRRRAGNGKAGAAAVK